VLSCAIATVTAMENAVTASAMIGSSVRSTNLRTATMVFTIRGRTRRAVGPTTYPWRTPTVVAPDRVWRGYLDDVKSMALPGVRPPLLTTATWAPST
jgi:hypothetical protein